MNNTNLTNHSKQLRACAKIINDCKEAKASGTNVKDWLKANNISHDTYYYWYAEVKKAFVNDSLPEIVAVNNELLSSSGSIPANPFNFSNVSSPSTRIPSYAPSCIKCIKSTFLFVLYLFSMLYISFLVSSFHRHLMNARV